MKSNMNVSTGSLTEQVTTVVATDVCRTCPILMSGIRKYIYIYIHKMKTRNKPLTVLIMLPLKSKYDTTHYSLAISLSLLKKIIIYTYLCLKMLPHFFKYK